MTCMKNLNHGRQEPKFKEHNDNKNGLNNVSRIFTKVQK